MKRAKNPNKNPEIKAYWVEKNGSKALVKKGVKVTSGGSGLLGQKLGNKVSNCAQEKPIKLAIKFDSIMKHKRVMIKPITPDFI
jgi:hypothetical protein